MKRALGYLALGLAAVGWLGVCLYAWREFIRWSCR